MSASSDTSVPLSSLQPGQRGKIAGFDLEGSVKGRVMEMGVTKGTTVEVVRFAPLGDPVEIKVRGYHLTLRKHEAEQIWVKRK